jgi:hypothetical protein
MNIAPLSAPLAGAAGSPLAQTKGSDVERAGQETVNQERRVGSERQAEAASGIGQTDEDQQASDRDADGRRLWERPAEGEAAPEDAAAEVPPIRCAKDATGQMGNLLDLTG